MDVPLSLQCLKQTEIISIEKLKEFSNLQHLQFCFYRGYNMLKSCFDCESDAILTDVIHKELGSGSVQVGTLVLIEYKLTEHIVEYTCRSCGTKWYVTTGIHYTSKGTIL